MTESYECFELNTCSSCEDPRCTCDCHDEQEFSFFYGWQDPPDESDGYFDEPCECHPAGATS